jgi:hypothetical protein
VNSSAPHGPFFSPVPLSNLRMHGEDCQQSMGGWHATPKRVVGQGRMTHYLKKTHGPLGGRQPWVGLLPIFNRNPSTIAANSGKFYPAKSSSSRFPQAFHGLGTIFRLVVLTCDSAVITLLQTG